MKKLIAMLACLTLVLTMFAGFSVSATGKATMRAEFVQYVVNGGNVYAQVKVYYEVPDTMVTFTSDEDFITGDVLWTGTGIAASQFGLKSSNSGFAPLAAAKSTSPLTTSAALADKSGLVFSAGLVHSNCVPTASGLLGQVTFTVDPSTYATGTTISFSGDEFLSVRSVNANVASVNEYRLANSTIIATGCEIPAYQAGSTEYAVTYATEDKFIWEANAATETTEGKVKFTVKPAFGYVITAVTGVDTVLPEGGEMTATLTADTEIDVTVAEKADAAITYNYVTYDENYGWIAFGKVPAGTATYGIDLDGTKYAGANAANGAFGVGFKGLAAGSYTAKAYAGDTLAATAATITVE